MTRVFILFVACTVSLSAFGKSVVVSHEQAVGAFFDYMVNQKLSASQLSDFMLQDPANLQDNLDAIVYQYNSQGWNRTDPKDLQLQATQTRAVLFQENFALKLEAAKNRRKWRGRGIKFSFTVTGLVIGFALGLKDVDEGKVKSDGDGLDQGLKKDFHPFIVAFGGGIVGYMAGWALSPEQIKANEINLVGGTVFDK